MKCANVPEQVWYKDQIWHVVGGCVCCWLRLWRQDPALATGAPEADHARNLGQSRRVEEAHMSRRTTKQRRAARRRKMMVEAAERIKPRYAKSAFLAFLLRYMPTVYITREALGLEYPQK